MVTEERVVNLETALASFIAHTDRMVAAIHEDIAASHQDIAEIRASNARTDRRLLELRQQGDKDREDFNRRMDQFAAQAEKGRQDFELRMDEWARKAEKDRKGFNKRLAETSDSMGTLIEDMVAPSGFKLAKAIFADQEAQTCGIRLKARHPANPGEMMEVDLLAVGPAKVLVVEVKRRVDAAKAQEYRQKLRRLPEFFPALAGKALCAAVASVYLDPSVIAFLNREKLYGIAMGDDVMEVVNLGQF